MREKLLPQRKKTNPLLKSTILSEQIASYTTQLRSSLLHVSMPIQITQWTRNNNNNKPSSIPQTSQEKKSTVRRTDLFLQQLL